MKTILFGQMLILCVSLHILPLLASGEKLFPKQSYADDTTMLVKVVVDTAPVGTELHIWYELDTATIFRDDSIDTFSPQNKYGLIADFMIFGRCNHMRYYWQLKFPNDSLETTEIMEISTTGYCGTALVLEKKVEEFEVFPNPANDHIYFNGKHSVGAFSLFDLIGNFVISFPLGNEIYVGMLPAGIYLYQIEENKAVLKKGKVIILH